MRRTPIFLLLGFAGLVLVVTLALDRPSQQVPRIDIEAPTHYFIPNVTAESDILRCNFSRGLDRESSYALWALQLQPCSLVSGWANPTTKGVMAAARRSKLSFSTDGTAWTHLVLDVKAVPHHADDRPQTVSVRLNRREIGTVEVPDTWGTVSLEIPPGVVREGVNNMTLTFAYRALYVKPKRRRSVSPLYAVDLRQVALVASPGRGRAHARMLRKIMRNDAESRSRPATQVFDRERQRYVLSRTGTLVMPLALPDRAESVVTDITSGASDGPRGRISLSIRGTASGALVSEQLSWFDETESSTTRSEITVDSLAGETCILWIDVDGGLGDAEIEIAPPRIVEREVQVENRTTARPRAQEDDEYPDIVLITLDAARPDHFSCYGYHRPTTPNIDRLAAESLVFTNAFALVPNTRRSVPTMITGLSFLNHRVTPESTLSDGAITLAEYLANIGYRTACFSASPNNSRAVGDDQGYQEFFELWNEVERERSRDPHYLSARVREWLAAIDDSRPLHLQLHFVPPHAPYDPAPEFDLFSDPSYDGPCDGYPKTILGIDKGKRSVSETDLEQLVALYDGNLRAADDAVAEVLAALQSGPRWKDTVVLVTADHGEAFFEHRRMGHNNTVYDEMLRVPFILRVPGAPDREDLELDRLATLADIVPTLLATASVPPVPGLDGIDLAHEARFRRGADGRYFIAQTAHQTPTWGIRTSRYKVILSNSGQGELYDLVKDPGEHRNLRFSQPELFVGLGLILTRNLVEPSSLARGPLPTEVPESDREMLEALGYVD